MSKLLVVFAFGGLLAAQALTQTPPKSGLVWQNWSDAAFARAKQEHRFVLLDLEAVWCHWCHVMDATTYRDPAVVQLLNSKYVLVKVDQDSRPDLSNRYEDYGWPATVVFDAARHEIVKRRGYVPPEQMRSMLQAIIDDPSPGPSVGPEAPLIPARQVGLSAAWRKALRRNYRAGYDPVQGSWGRGQKFLDWDSVEYSMVLAQTQHDAAAARRVRFTLSQQLHLLDPVWGGVYQYSTDGNWNSPHYEKIMQMQAENLRLYSLAYSYWRDPKYLHAAQEIHRFLVTFLRSPEGAFYTSQDADLIDGVHSTAYFALSDAGRRRLGIPRVDKNMYARENGWAITAFVALYSASGDTTVLNEAVQAARWVLANRSLPGCGFHHGGNDSGGPYLGDSVAMSRAFLSLYAATASREWLTRAEQAMNFIGENFRDPSGLGFVTAKQAAGEDRYQPRPERDENVMVARTANLLFHSTGQARYKEIAAQTMRYLAARPVVESLPASSILLADYELTHDPLRITVVGAKHDAAAARLFQTALHYPSTYKQVEWLDKHEGPLPDAACSYPDVDRAAAFICAGNSASAPIFAPEQLRAQMSKAPGPARSRLKSASVKAAR